MEYLISLAIFIALILIGYFAGTAAEKAHYKSIKDREEKTKHQMLTVIKNIDIPGDIESSKLVSGCCVVSVDYFKKIAASFRNMIGGSVKSYQTLVDRAKREAILRMKAQAPNADMFINLRVETSTISSNAQSSTGSIEALAYGTAIKIKK